MSKALVNSSGKVLLRDGKVATSDSADCCCNVTCDCPSEDAGVSGTLTFTLTDTRGTTNCTACNIAVDATLNFSDTVANHSGVVCNTFNINFIEHTLDAGDGTASCDDGPTPLDLAGQLNGIVGTFIDEGENCIGVVRLEVDWINIAANLTGTPYCGSDATLDTAASCIIKENFPIDNVFRPQGTYTMDHTFNADPGGCPEYDVHAVFTVTIA